MSTFVQRQTAREAAVVRSPGRSVAGLAVVDGDLIIGRANATFSALFGFSSGTVVGAAVPALFLDAVREGVRGELSGLFEGRKADFGERLVGLGPGGRLFLADVTGRLIGRSSELLCLVLLVVPVPTSEQTEAVSAVPLDELDVRILEGLAAGESTVRIALSLHLSRQAVDYRIGTMLRRLGVQSRAVLVAKAYAVGLLDRARWPPRVAIPRSTT